MTTNGLTVSEQQQLEQCEDVIRRGLGEFVSVGRALAQVRDGKLYRHKHKTFESYCKAEFEIERAHAYRLIAASEMSPMGDTESPANERQARELAKAPAPQRPAVMREAVADGKPPTAEKIRAATEKLTKAEPIEVKDGLGNVVAEKRLHPVFEQVEVFGEIAKDAAHLLIRIKGLCETPLGRFIHLQTVEAELKNVQRAMRFARPYTVCPYCNGRNDKCKACQGGGWVCQDVYKSAPPEMKKGEQCD